MNWRQIFRGAAACVAMGGLAASVQAAVDPGFTVSGVQVTTSAALGGGTGTNQAVGTNVYEWQSADGGPKEEITAPQVGVPGKFEVVQYYNDYKKVDVFDTYQFAGLQSTDNDLRAGNWVSFSGTVTIDPQSVLHGHGVSIFLDYDGHYQDEGTAPVPLPGGVSCCAPAAPSYFLTLDGGATWQSLHSSTTFYPGDTPGEGEGDGSFSSHTQKDVVANQFSFKVLAYAGAVTNISNFSLSVSSILYGDSEITVRTREVLGSYEIPALASPVDEPSHLVLMLAGGVVVASMARRKAKTALTA